MSLYTILCLLTWVASQSMSQKIVGQMQRARGYDVTLKRLLFHRPRRREVDLSFWESQVGRLDKADISDKKRARVSNVQSLRIIRGELF
jgi:hypothetical protein